MRFAIIPTLAAFVFAQSANAQCWDDKEVSAARTLEMQYQLEAATEQCVQIDPDIRTEFIRFRDTHSSKVNQSISVLEKAFSRANGFQKRAFDEYGIKVRQKHSQKTDKSERYCSALRDVLSQMTTASKMEEAIRSNFRSRKAVIHQYCPAGRSPAPIEGPVITVTRGPAYSPAFVSAFGPLKAAFGDRLGASWQVERQVQALGAKASTPKEKFDGGELIYSVGQRMGNPKYQLIGRELMLDSGQVDAEQIGPYNFEAYQLSNALAEDQANVDQYRQIARGYLEKAIAADYSSRSVGKDDLMIALAEAWFAEKSMRRGLDWLSEAIKYRKDRNRKVDEKLYLKGIQVAYTNSLPETSDFLFNWLGDYPSAENWRNAIVKARAINDYNDREELDLLRLGRRLNALSEADYTTYAKIASSYRHYTEVEALIQEGLREGHVSSDDTRLAGYLKEARKNLGSSKRREDLATLETRANSRLAGVRTVVTAADTFLGAGQFQKAASLYEKALGMSGVNQDEVRTRLGIAYTRMGSSSSAQTGLAQVGGNREPIAKLWAAYARKGGERVVPKLARTKTVRRSTVGTAGAKRVALVIGNSSYNGFWSRLPNATNDADLMYQTLDSLGFDVEVVTDGDQAAINAALRRFGQRLRRAGRDATGLFFYAGHGVQASGENFIIPANSDVVGERQLGEAVSANEVLKQLEARNVSTRIFIMDACRDNGLWKMADGRTGSRGLAMMQELEDSVIQFSTGANQAALDGTGSNSPFTKALAKQLVVPGLGIESVLRNVRREVNEVTGGKQRPWTMANLLTNPVFARKN